MEPWPDERCIGYPGTYQLNGNSYVAVYGWMQNPLVEYYIAESFGTYDPSSDAQSLVQVTCNSLVYSIGKSTLYDKPSIEGTRIFDQYWSVRQQKRTRGTVNTGCHFDAWSNAGLSLGSHNYQIVATEGYHSSGYAEITVSDVG